MISFYTVVRQPLFSKQSQGKMKTTGAFLTNAGLQSRLRAVNAILRGHPACGPGGTGTVNGVRYQSLFGEDWLVEAQAFLILGGRHPKSLPDQDNLWSPVQNALAFPPRGLALRPGWKGDTLYTIVPADCQFTRVDVQVVPDSTVPPENDQVVFKFTAYPPPAFALSLAI